MCISVNRQIPQNSTGQHDSFIPYAEGVTERIGRILRKNNITPIFKSYHTVLPPVKDTEDEILEKGIYQIPCEYGMSYIGETGRSVLTRVKDHERYIRL